MRKVRAPDSGRARRTWSRYQRDAEPSSGCVNVFLDAQRKGNVEEAAFDPAKENEENDKLRRKRGQKALCNGSSQLADGVIIRKRLPIERRRRESTPV